ncbi:hypothetical protein VNO78_28424 [Psophocarpus tetragonolobus]|uniref:Uncharacterized protein n=1 Tax=Psophocarpus tetragonolobus TaxID=3891 RepID=A0AAN9XCA9_PSOTE
MMTWQFDSFPRGPSEPVLPSLLDSEIGPSLSVTTFYCAALFFFEFSFSLHFYQHAYVYVPKKESEKETGSSVLGGNMDTKGRLRAANTSHLPRF